MKQDTYHGILLDVSFYDKDMYKEYRIFNKIESDNWKLIGVEVDSERIDKAISEVQKEMRSDQPFYNHFYNDEDIIVIFKDEVFRVKSHASSWNGIIEYGKKLEIPEIQLDFWPNRFQDEIHYFKK